MDTSESGQVQAKTRKRGHGCLVALVIAVVIVTIPIALFAMRTYQHANAPLAWPTSGLAAMLPEPSGDVGSIDVDTRSRFSATVRRQSPTDFREYTEACERKGFSNDDGWASDTTYAAKNTDGYMLDVRYSKDDEAMTVNLKAPISVAKPAASSARETKSHDVPASPAAASAATTVAASATTGDDAASAAASAVENAGVDVIDNAVVDVAAGAVSPDFKQVMDDYEAFMNEYVDFMVTYQNADATDAAAMLEDYSSLLTQEATWVEKVNAIDPSTLSAADSAYYLQVTSRVLKRLSEAGVAL